MPVAIAASSQISADAGAWIADQGGNAVDAALAAALASLVTDPGIISPCGGVFISIWPPDGPPVVIDGYVQMPGLGSSRRLGEATWEVVFEYHGECHTVIGPGSVATPGDFAALELASQRHGHLPWAELFEPAIHWARKGFPLSGGAAEYMGFAHEAIFSWNEQSRQIMHPEGHPLRFGSTVYIPDLAESLETIARGGADTLYQGDLGACIARGVQAEGGLLNETDLRNYRAEIREPILVEFGDWKIATNPAPSVGGPCLAAMLRLLSVHSESTASPEAIAWLVDVQQAVLGYRRRNLDGIHEDIYVRVEQLLNLCDGMDPSSLLSAPSTIHCSAVDREGWACAITASAGYSSGMIVPGTGIWLNNSLGEVDLHTRGLGNLPPGARLSSNMAPTVARRNDGAVLAIGSPGASRITTAVSQVLWRLLFTDMSLRDAVEFPRLHVELPDDTPRVACEPGLPLETCTLPLRHFEDKAMFFGGVQAASWGPNRGLQAAGDPRRGGREAFGRSDGATS